MKKIFILLVLSSVLMLLVSTGWCQITPITSDVRIFSSDPLDGGNWVGNGTINQNWNIITVQLILVEDTTLQTSNAFSYDGIDPVTGVGMRIYQQGGDSFWSANLGGGSTPGQKQGILVQVQGYVDQYFQTLEFVPAQISGVADSDVLGDITCLGTGYAIPTTLISSLASVTSVDITGQTGGLAYLDKLVRINNISLLTTASRYTTQITHGVWTTSGTIPLIDASIANVTTVYEAIYPSYSSLTIIQLDLPASEDSTFRHSTASNQSTFFAIVTAGPFNLVAVFDQNAFPGSALNQDAYWFFGRGASLGADVTPYIAVSPANIVVHPGGASVPFTATGGFLPYTWSLSNPAVGSIDSISGVFSPSSTAGTTNVLVTDSKGYTATVVGVVTNTVTSAPLAPDISMDSMAVPRVTDFSIIKPSER